MKLLHDFVVRLCAGTGLPRSDCCKLGEMSSVCFRCFSQTIPFLSVQQGHTQAPITYTSSLSLNPIQNHHPVFCFGFKHDQKKPSINLFPVTLYWIALPVLHLIIKLHFVYGWPNTIQTSPFIPFPSGVQWNLDDYPLPSTALAQALHRSPNHATRPPLKTSTKR